MISFLPQISEGPGGGRHFATRARPRLAKVIGPTRLTLFVSRYRDRRTQNSPLQFTSLADRCDKWDFGQSCHSLRAPWYKTIMNFTGFPSFLATMTLLFIACMYCVLQMLIFLGECDPHPPPMNKFLIQWGRLFCSLKMIARAEACSKHCSNVDVLAKFGRDFRTF